MSNPELGSRGHQELERSGVKLVEVSAENHERYDHHGISKLSLPYPGAIPGTWELETSLLPNAKHAWLKMKKNGVILLISSGTQKPPKSRTGKTRYSSDINPQVIAIQVHIRPRVRNVIPDRFTDYKVHMRALRNV